MYLHERFCTWLGHLKLSRVIITVSVILFIVPLVTHYYLAKYDSSSVIFENNPLRESLEALGDLSTMNAADLKVRIEEMLRIKASVSTELRELEGRRTRLQREAAAAAGAADSARAEHARAQQELQRLRASADQARLAQLDAMRRDAPLLAPPLRLLPRRPPPALDPPDPAHEADCRMYSCFDYSRCSLTSGFPVYFYDPDEYSLLDGAEVDGFLKTSLKQVLGSNPHITDDPNIACVYVVLIGEAFPVEKTKRAVGETNDWKLNLTALRKLPYWGGDGRNHILLSVARRELARPRGVDGGTGRAIIAQAHFPRGRYRRGFDLVIPPALGPPSGDVWKECEPMAPARRHYLLSFQGSQTPLAGAAGDADRAVVAALTAAAAGRAGGAGGAGRGGDEGGGGGEGGGGVPLIELQWQCEPGVEAAPPGEWALCGTERSRRALLARSSFALVPGGGADSSALLLARLLEALRAGAVPVVLGGHALELPYAEVVEWSRAAVLVAAARAAELPLLLRAVPDADLLLLRRQGRQLWERYAATLEATTQAALAVVRTRLSLPAAVAPPAAAPPAFGASHAPPLLQPPPADAAPDETLGPLEPPFPSPAYIRNFSLAFVHKYDMWNEWFEPFGLFPALPWDGAVTSEARFVGSRRGYRPLAGGAGGAGRELSEALGGDYPREQFTIVILNYERESVLAAALTRLRHLPYLNKVVVIWNGPSSPAAMWWPESGAPVSVVRAARNSLNNRFLPYDVIETDAVLCVDDDAHLRHDEIIFAFRVWRQHRDQIVGFPGRYHAWDLNYNNGFLYNSNYSCELSMVLTGAAFIHRYYMYAYWRQLPQAIRDYVDEYMNCEDIAMNFLVAHITRKPPIKVTSRWTFRCPGCPVTLSADETHFPERHKCIQFFSEVMGYTPLMTTQYRADSVLFKTRISHDKQKCFKFI